MEILRLTKLIVFVFLSQFLFSQGLEILTLNGKIVGAENLKTKNGRVIYSFTSIPYAKPPVGPLRFKDAVPPEPWKEPFDATRNGPMCPQILSYTQEGSFKVSGQEDCLILNVYTPKVNQNAKLPVMVFIHGGGFFMGTSSAYGPEFLLDRDIVLVTINYRLGALGFLSTDDEAVPANLGLKDQAIAIKWVHDNIEKFGGDSNLVTVFGDSAGGASAHFHVLSPLSKGLIHRSISMSGTAFNSWATVPSQLLKEKTRALATLCGCPQEPSQELLECMQAVPIALLLEMTRRFDDSIIPFDMIFAPTVESAKVKGAFLIADPKQIESQVPFMVGVSSGEGVYSPSSTILGADGKFVNAVKTHPEYIVPRLLYFNSKFPKEKVPAVTKEILQFYFGGKAVDKKTVPEFVDMMTDGLFLEGAVEAAEKYSGDAYFYYYDHEQSVSFSAVYGSGEVQGACHSDILLNLFPLHGFFPNRTLSQTDIKVSEKVIDIWTNFAKTGKLIGGNLELEPTGRSTQSKKYLHITAEGPSVKENLLPKRVTFWTTLNELKDRGSGGPPTEKFQKDEF